MNRSPAEDGPDPSAPVAAFVRELSPRIAEAELTHLERRPIDLDRARRQHDGYVALLEDLGLEVVFLPPLPDHPDGVFVEDVLVVVDGLAILTRPGATTRRGEIDSVRPFVEARGYDLVTIEGPATLDGGDVLQVGDTVYVGAGTRTTDDGASQLAERLAPRGRRVVRVPVRQVLHLKSAATALPDGAIVAVPGCVPTSAFEGREVIDALEPAGGDVLLVGDIVVISASAPRTAERIAARGFDVVPIEVDELEKAEAGVTCMSVLLGSPRRSTAAG
jgi:dimethylargininase